MFQLVGRVCFIGIPQIKILLFSLVNIFDVSGPRALGG